MLWVLPHRNLASPSVGGFLLWELTQVQKLGKESWLFIGEAAFNFLHTHPWYFFLGLYTLNNTLVDCSLLLPLRILSISISLWRLSPHGCHSNLATDCDNYTTLQHHLAIIILESYYQYHWKGSISLALGAWGKMSHDLAWHIRCGGAISEWPWSVVIALFYRKNGEALPESTDTGFLTSLNMWGL